MRLAAESAEGAAAVGLADGAEGESESTPTGADDVLIDVDVAGGGDSGSSKEVPEDS